MTFDRETELLLKINSSVNTLMDVPSSRTYGRAQELKTIVADYCAQIDERERRVRQTRELSENPNRLVNWTGEIGGFCRDLVFHADRLGRPIRGTFNETIITADPGADPDRLIGEYMRGRR